MSKLQRFWDFFVTTLIAFAIAVGLMILGWSSANAGHVKVFPEQTTSYCAVKGGMEDILKNNYQEAQKRQSFKADDAGALFTWWESNEEDASKRTWTLTVTYPDGKTCILAAGMMNWELYEAPYEDLPVW